MKFPTFGRADYDPNEVVKDGPFRAPRKWQHVLKVLIACTVYACVLTVGRALDWHADVGQFAAIVALFGPLAFSEIRERVAPTDPDKHSAALQLFDKLADGACGAVPIVLELFASGRPIAAVITAGAVFAVYRMFRNGARP